MGGDPVNVSAGGEAGRGFAEDLHRECLRHFNTSGPFLVGDSLVRLWPQGVPGLASAAVAALAAAESTYASARGALDSGSADFLADCQRVTEVWVRAVLTEVAGWPEGSTFGQWGCVWGSAGSVASPDARVQVTACGVLRTPQGSSEALVLAVPPGDGLYLHGVDGWAASPVERMIALLRDGQSAQDAGPRVGVVTDGRWWGVVSVTAEGTASS
ncbi:MAG: hypothetical protein ACRC0L_05510, partial [Angustibacter sp.]